jgi:predicted nucleotidyltransferase
MPNKLENFAIIKKDFKDIIKNTLVLDVVVFGSYVKGKTNPKDIDVAVLVKEETKINLDKHYHISVINLEDFFIKPVSLVNTLLREGFSLKHNKLFSEVFKFSSKLLFTYELKDKNASFKVKVVNILRGLKKNKGLVEKQAGEWLSRQVFFAPIKSENIFKDFFNQHSIKYKMFYLLIH